MSGATQKIVELESRVEFLETTLETLVDLVNRQGAAAAELYAQLVGRLGKLELRGDRG